MEIKDTENNKMVVVYIAINNDYILDNNNGI